MRDSRERLAGSSHLIESALTTASRLITSFAHFYADLFLFASFWNDVLLSFYRYLGSFSCFNSSATAEMEADESPLLPPARACPNDRACDLPSQEKSKWYLSQPPRSGKLNRSLLTAIILLLYIAVGTTLNQILPPSLRDPTSCLLRKEDFPYCTCSVNGATSPPRLKAHVSEAPANNALRYKRERLEDYRSTLYSGSPSAEQAAA